MEKIFNNQASHTTKAVSLGNSLLALCANPRLELDKVEAAINAGADLVIKNGYGHTPLIIAADAGHLEIVKRLIAKKVPLNEQDMFGNTALIVAVIKGHFDIVQILLEAGADPDIQDSKGFTAMILAAKEGRMNMVEAIFERGAALNKQTKEGRTALMEAAHYWGNIGIIRFLIEKKADVLLRDSQNQTAFDCAHGRDYIEVKAALEKRMREVELENFIQASVTLQQDMRVRKPVKIKKLVISNR